MAEHISNERLAALLDDGVEDVAAREHLASCPGCRRELDLLRRMRMALSAMDELAPPADQWDRIESALSRRTAGTPGAGSPGAADATGRSGNGAEVDADDGGIAVPLGAWIRDIGWLRAAAGIVLFVGGLGLGTLLGTLPGSGGGSSPARSEAARGTPDRAAAATATGETTAASRPAAVGESVSVRRTAEDLAANIEGRGTDEILRQLEALGSGEPDPREAYRNPTAAAERLARLDALVRAAREALEEDPADPAMNQFLFRVVEERQQLNQALHLASLDYR